jgi:branched-chain amino acid transport system permease protein
MDAPHGTTRSFLTALLLIGLVLGAALLIEQFGSSYLRRVVLLLGIDMILVVALQLSNGCTGVFSLGQIGFMALGAYTAAILTLPLRAKATNLRELPAWLAAIELGFLPSTLIAGLVALLVALVIGVPLLRLSGHYVAVATLGFLVIVRQVLINADSFTRGSRTFAGVPPYTSMLWVYAWVVVAIYVCWRVIRSPYGRAMLAAREDPIAARAVGVNIFRARMLAFAQSAFLTGVAGALFAHFILAFSPNTFDFALTFTIITMLLLGGMGSISGAIAGAILVTLLGEMLRNLEAGFALGPFELPPLFGLSQIVLAVLFVLAMIYRPQGLLGDRELWPRWGPRARLKGRDRPLRKV